MYIACDWLSDYINHQQSPDTLARILTNTGLEVEGQYTFIDRPPHLESLIVGHVLTAEAHPDADNLTVTTVDTGGEAPSQIICGAPNVAAGQKVVVAPVGATIQHINGKQLTVQKSKIRGVRSYGMIVAEDEIGLGHDHEGILVLEDEARAGQPFTAYRQFPSQETLEISLTPNRGDAASHLGVARDLSAYLDIPVQHPDPTAFQVDQSANPVDIRIADQHQCPRYTGAVIANVTVGSSPHWLQHRLKAVGLQPVNNIVDVTNYVMMEWGHPLHAFDYDQISGRALNIVRANEGTSFTTLDGVQRELSGEELMIADEQQNLAMAGIIGGQHSGIGEGTSTIFLESACFNATTIRKAATHHQLMTDASFRFERGTDPEITPVVLRRAALLIQQVAGGSISSDVMDAYPGRTAPAQLQLSYSYLYRLLGDHIPADRVQRILLRLGFTIDEATEDGLLVTVPTFRTDVTRPVDVVEEVVRIYSLDALGSESTPAVRLAQQFDHTNEHLKQRLSRYLTAQGFYETVTPPFTSQETESELLNGAGYQPVPVVNPLNQAQDGLRTTPLLNGLEAISYNLRRKQQNLRLFELARTYQQNGDATAEHDVLSLFLTGKYHEPTWYQAAAEVDLYYLKGIVHNLLQASGVADWQTAETRNAELADGLMLSAQGKEMASLGSVSPGILKAFDIRQPVLHARLDLDFLKALYQRSAPSFRPISKFPQIERDIAVLVPAEQSYQVVKDTIEATDIPELTDFRLFDVYQGEHVPEGTKSLALRLTLQDPEKTMEDERIDAVVDQLLSALQKGAEAQIRG